jgi:hypothetical protein
MHKSEMRGRVKSLHCKPWIVLMLSIHHRNYPGRRLRIALSALHSASSPVVKIELKECSQNINAFPPKINTHLTDPFIRDPSVKTSVIHIVHKHLCTQPTDSVQRHMSWEHNRVKCHSGFSLSPIAVQ